MEIADWNPGAILNARANASWLEWVCLCGVNLNDRLPASTVPETLRGITYQGGKNGSGSLQTLDYVEWDHATRSGLSSQWDPGQWNGGFRKKGQSLSSTLVKSPINCIGRLCQFSYKFQFNEEYTFGQITPVLNCCCIIPVIPPCVSPWFEVPTSVCDWTMERKTNEDKLWARKSKMCPMCCNCNYDYTLFKVVGYKDNMIPGPGGAEWHKIQPGWDQFAANAPERILCMR
jgi:hypothetical protein